MSPYAVSKLAGEHYLQCFAALHGIEYVVLRYANVMGPRQHADGECGVVPIFVGNVVAGKPSRLFAYDDMPDELKPILAREMETYAGFLEHTDHHIGRLVDALLRAQVRGEVRTRGGAVARLESWR